MVYILLAVTPISLIKLWESDYRAKNRLNEKGGENCFGEMPWWAAKTSNLVDAAKRSGSIPPLERYFWSIAAKLAEKHLNKFYKISFHQSTLPFADSSHLNYAFTLTLHLLKFSHYLLLLKLSFLFVIKFSLLENDAFLWYFGKFVD